MGLMFRRRRPIARMAAGAATAGIAYHAGKSHEQQAQVNEQAQAAYAAAQPQYAPPPQQYQQPAASGGTGDLDHLVELHNSGALSDEEFAAAKSRLLGL
jgi:Short C-terminal domain